MDKITTMIYECGVTMGFMHEAIELILDDLKTHGAVTDETKVVISAADEYCKDFMEKYHL